MGACPVLLMISGAQISFSSMGCVLERRWSPLSSSSDSACSTQQLHLHFWYQDAVIKHLWRAVLARAYPELQGATEKIKLMATPSSLCPAVQQGEFENPFIFLHSPVMLFFCDHVARSKNEMKSTTAKSISSAGRESSLHHPASSCSWEAGLSILALREVVQGGGMGWWRLSCPKSCHWHLAAST